MIEKNEKTKHEIRTFCLLPLNWDGYGAVRIDAKAIENALALVNKAEIAVEAFPLSTGGVQLEYDLGGVELEIEVHADDIAVCVSALGKIVGSE